MNLRRNLCGWVPLNVCSDCSPGQEPQGRQDFRKWSELPGFDHKRHVGYPSRLWEIQTLPGKTERSVWVRGGVYHLIRAPNEASKGLRAGIRIWSSQRSRGWASRRQSWDMPWDARGTSSVPAHTFVSTEEVYSMEMGEKGNSTLGREPSHLLPASNGQHLHCQLSREY